MKIIAINLTRMTNELHAQFHENVLVLIERATAVALGIVSKCTSYKQALENELKALLIIRKSELTAKIAEQDRVRDGTFRGFSDAVKSARNHFDPDYRNAANLLWNVFLHYGNITKKTLHTQTAATNDMLRELERPDLQNAIDVLHVRDWVDRMQQDNQAFNDLIIQRVDEFSERTTLRMSTARLKTDKYYRVIVTHFDNILTMEESDAVMDEFLTKLNVLIKEYKEILAQEFGRKNTNANPSPKETVVEVEKLEEGKFKITKN